jgi:hypothetical protein
VKSKKETRINMSDEEKRWPFDGFFLKLAEAQREYEQEQHIDPASLTEDERQQKLQEILDCIKASRKKKKEADEQLDPIVPEEEPETAGATPQPAKQYITDLVGEDYKNWHGIVVLDAGTNSGKTYFILKTLLPWAYEHRKRILILCNREALRSQIERDVNRLGRIEVSYEDYDPALGGIVNKPAIDNKYEHTIRVETYQWLETFLQRNEDAAKTYLRSFDYIVSDEYHYMVTDASFNDHVDASYEAIKELWTTKTCIFMSATARPFFDYWKLRKMIPEGQHYRLPMDYRFVSSVKFFYRDDDERALGLDIVVLSEAVFAGNQRDVVRVAVDEIMDIRLYAHSFQTLAEVVGRVLAVIMRYDNAAHGEPAADELIAQPEHILVVGDAKVGAHLVLDDVFGADDNHYLYLVTDFAEHAQL